MLRNPTKLAGFLRRLEGEVQHGRFQQADRAYALHELRRMLLRVMEDIEEQPESAALVAEAVREVTARFESIRGSAPDDLAPQLRILESEIAP